MNNQFLKLAMVCSLILWAGICLGPIRDLQAPHGGNFLPQTTNDRLTNMQAAAASNLQHKEVGVVPMQASSLDPAFIPSDRASAANLSQAIEKINTSDPGAKANLNRARLRVDTQKSEGSSRWILGFMFLSIGLGSVFALKSYVNKVAPEPPGTKRQTKAKQDVLVEVPQKKVW